MRVSVILSTYNQPEWLELVLWGYAAQTCQQFQIIIADDGSTGVTGQKIAALQRWTSLDIQHLWHPHRGFRKCTILNQAIEAAQADYLIFSDGDCIPRRDFVQRHRQLAARGRFLSGGAIRLPLDLSLRIRPEDVLTGRVAEVDWLRRSGLARSRRDLRLMLHRRVAEWLDTITPTRPTWNGGNSSAWRNDLLAVNGYDERMQHGGLDRELGERLEHAGIRGKQVRHRAVCLHLDHTREYAGAVTRRVNDGLRRQTRRSRAIWTPHGILKAGSEAA